MRSAKKRIFEFSGFFDSLKSPILGAHNKGGQCVLRRFQCGLGRFDVRFQLLPFFAHIVLKKEAAKLAGLNTRSTDGDLYACGITARGAATSAYREYARRPIRAMLRR